MLSITDSTGKTLTMPKDNIDYVSVSEWKRDLRDERYNAWDLEVNVKTKKGLPHFLNFQHKDVKPEYTSKEKRQQADFVSKLRSYKKVIKVGFRRIKNPDPPPVMPKDFAKARHRYNEQQKANRACKRKEILDQFNP